MHGLWNDPWVADDEVDDGLPPRFVEALVDDGEAISSDGALSLADLTFPMDLWFLVTTLIIPSTNCLAQLRLELFPSDASVNRSSPAVEFDEITEEVDKDEESVSAPPYVGKPFGSGYGNGW